VHTARTIGLIVGWIVAAGLAATAWLVAALGWGPGLSLVASVAVAAVVTYHHLVAPWHRRWGATGAEAVAAMPGDDLVPGADVTTRAVAVEVPAAAVWPWLVQLGFGRAGWYSYDWIDNDLRPSAGRIVPELQHLDVGDRIDLTEDRGFVVTGVDEGRSITAAADDGSASWALLVVPSGPGCRLVSRFRFRRGPRSVASLLWAAVVGPGAFLMERRMLLGIKHRAETAAVPERVA
jgi:hypothetical protein